MKSDSGKPEVFFVDATGSGASAGPVDLSNVTDVAGIPLTAAGTLRPMPFGIGIWELLILLLVLLLVFGPKRLPEMGRQLGKGMREFRDSVSGKDGPVDDVTDELAELPEAQAAPTTSKTTERETVS